MEAEIIHAVGVCFDVRERASNIIHAVGVRFGFPSSAPKARIGLLVARAGLRLWDIACELVAEILEVVRADTQVEHFLYHGKEIGQRTDRTQR